MFKVKNNLCPEILQSIFSQKTSHSSSNALFQRPNINTVHNGEESLRWFGPIVWDIMIPGIIKAISDLKEHSCQPSRILQETPAFRMILPENIAESGEYSRRISQKNVAE